MAITSVASRRSVKPATSRSYAATYYDRHTGAAASSGYGCKPAARLARSASLLMTHSGRRGDGCGLRVKSFLFISRPAARRAAQQAPAWEPRRGTMKGATTPAQDYPPTGAGDGPPSGCRSRCCSFGLARGVTCCRVKKVRMAAVTASIAPIWLPLNPSPNDVPRAFDEKVESMMGDSHDGANRIQDPHWNKGASHEWGSLIPTICVNVWLRQSKPVIPA